MQAESYMRVLAISGPFSGALFAVNAALRGAGDTRTPFLAMIVVNLVNIVVSWTLVFGPAPLGGHGVAGIAAGTVIGWIAGLADGRAAGRPWQTGTACIGRGKACGRTAQPWHASCGWAPRKRWKSPACG